MKKIGFTTTIPVEIILAAGAQPVDLNNIFITAESPESYIDTAEAHGLPRNICAWIKGIYTAVDNNSVDEVIAVTEGDCSNSHALAEIFTARGIPVHTFSYPYGAKDRHGFIKNQMEQLAESLGTTMADALKYAEITDPVRQKLRLLDRLTVEGKVSGFENQLWLVTSTDFNGDMAQYERELDAFLKKAQKRDSVESEIRLGFIGVPSIFSDIYQFIEDRGAAVVFNEIQRQFAIPSDDADYVQRYIDYTYPYDVFGRIEDIRKQAAERRLDGLVHYVQSFCYRQIQDLTFRDRLDIPMLTIEGDGPGNIDARTKIRIESFIEMLQERKNG